jgi:branched-chain amino acid transport system substrate-binding protein
MRTAILNLSALSTLLLAGCSFTTASGLSECETSAQCGTDMVCSNNFCLPQPAGCDQRFGDVSADAVQIGAALPISLTTGPNPPKDSSEEAGLKGIRLALDAINSRSVAGKKLALTVCDTAADLTITQKQVEWLVKEKKIVALLTAGSSQTLAAAAFTLPAGVLTMSSSATSPELTSREDNSKLGLLWRTSPSDAIQGKVIANLLLADPEFSSAQRVGILYLKDAYGEGLFNVITEQLRLRGKAHRAALYERQTNDLGPPLSQIDAFDPDITVIVGFEDDVSRFIERAATSTNLKASDGHRWFFSDSAKDAALLSNSGTRGPIVRSQISGAYGTAPAQGAGQAFNAFRSTYISQYQGEDPSKFSFTSHAYDSMYLLGLAVAYSQGTTNAVTGIKMAEGLTKVSSGTTIELTSTNVTQATTELAAGRSINVEGASGNLTFDAAGEAPSPIELWQVDLVENDFNTIRNVPPPP